MTEPVDSTARWVYRGVWGVLTRWFRVPRQPPQLPQRQGESVQSFGPAAGFLRYLRFKFWVALVVKIGMIGLGWLGLVLAAPTPGLILTPIFLVLAIVPGAIVYLAIQLRYDTTWYVMNERALRIRRGIFKICEVTITFENVQNVTVTQEPLQRLLGIANVLVDTAGGGAPGHEESEEEGTRPSHRGLVEGVANAHQIREMILVRLRTSTTAGLGDECARETQPAWTPQHLQALNEIRDELRAVSSG